MEYFIFQATIDGARFSILARSPRDVRSAILGCTDIVKFIGPVDGE